MPSGVKPTVPRQAEYPEPFRPYDPYGKYWNMVQNPMYWKVDMPKTYYNDFENYFKDYWGGIQPYGQYNVGQAGLGMYNSPLLGLTEQQITTNLTNPNQSLAMGLAKDQIRGAGMAAEQSLSNQLAATGRGGSFATAAQGGLQRDIAKSESEQYRTIALQTQEKAIQEAMQFEAMRGGFYNESMQRELSNAALALDAWKTGQISYQQYLQAQSDALKTFAGMAQWGTQTEMSADAQTYQNLLGLQGMEDAKRRQGYEGMEQYQNEMWRYNYPSYFGLQQPRVGQQNQVPQQPYRPPKMGW